MLHVFRESLGRYIAIAILALIAVTFVFFGIDFSITTLSFAAKVDGEEIPIREFERELQVEQQRYERDLRIELTDDLRLFLRQNVIERMILREVLLQRARDAGYRISDERLIESIRGAPVFQVGGQFSPDIYQSTLVSQGLTPAGFEARQRDELTIVALEDALAASSFLTPAEFRRNIELYYERREAAWALFAVTDFLDQIEVGDEAIAEYYAGNGARFMTEEAVDIELVELTLASIADAIEISDAELREYYEDEAERLASGEERRVSHILIEAEGDDLAAAEAEAERVIERLEAGEDFAAVAAEVSDDLTGASGGDLGWISRGMFSGSFEDTLFGMDVGEVGGPVETEFGVHVLKLEEIRASEQPPFESVRDGLRDELASERAYADFYEIGNELGLAAYDAIDDLASVAQEFGLMLETIEGLTRGGGSTRFVDPAPVIAAAFDDEAIAAGESSDLIELGEDSVAVLRVTAHHPPEQQPLEDVIDEIRDILARELAAELAAEAATAFMDELDTAALAEGTLDPLILAETHGGSWNEPAWIERDTAGVPAAIRSLVFAQPKPAAAAVLRTATSGGDEAVVLFSAVEPGVPEDIADAEREQGRQELVTQMTNAEVNAYAADARRRASVRVPDTVLNPDL